MGKIKSKAIKRTANTLFEKGISFQENFDNNKKILGRSMPSKKIRNQVAGLAVRMKQQQRIAEEKLLKGK